MLADIFPTVDEPEQRERLLAQFLTEKGLSRERWDMMAARNAMLRKLAEPRIAVTEEMLRREFGEQYGRQVVVRHIEVESLDQAERVLNELKDGADFARLAVRLSKNPSAAQGGLLPAISQESPPEMPLAIRQVALAMETPGELSDPVKVGYAFHILKLQEVIEPKDVRFEEVRPELIAAVTARLTRQMQQQVLRELMSKAQYEYVDPVLKSLENRQGSR
jgi:parvulin-like peptidyl-prolyl isomerase